MTDVTTKGLIVVPAGDGEPAQWMRYGDLLADADKRRRQARWYEEDTCQHVRRLMRLKEISDEAARRSGISSDEIGREYFDFSSIVLTHDEFVESSQLQAAIDAFERAACRDGRQEAIASDMEAGRYTTIAED